MTSASKPITGSRAISITLEKAFLHVHVLSSDSNHRNHIVLNFVEMLKKYNCLKLEVEQLSNKIQTNKTKRSNPQDVSHRS